MIRRWVLKLLENFAFTIAFIFASLFPFYAAAAADCVGNWTNASCGVQAATTGADLGGGSRGTGPSDAGPGETGNGGEGENGNGGEGEGGEGSGGGGEGEGGGGEGGPEGGSDCGCEGGDKH